MCVCINLNMLLLSRKDGCIVVGATFMSSGTHLLVQTGFLHRLPNTICVKGITEFTRRTGFRVQASPNQTGLSCNNSALALHSQHLLNNRVLPSPRHL